MVRDGWRDNEQTGWVNGDRRIIALCRRHSPACARSARHRLVLVETCVAAVFHDPRVRIREVVLVASARRAFVFTRCGCPLSDLGVIGGLFGRITFLRAGCQHGFGFGEMLQTFLAKRNFIGDTEARGQGQFTLIGLFAECKPFAHWLAQRRFQFQSALVTDGMRLGGIGMDFAAVETDVAQLKDARGWRTPRRRRSLPRCAGWGA